MSGDLFLGFALGRDVLHGDDSIFDGARLGMEERHGVHRQPARSPILKVHPERKVLKRLPRAQGNHDGKLVGRVVCSVRPEPLPARVLVAARSRFLACDAHELEASRIDFNEASPRRDNIHAFLDRVEDQFEQVLPLALFIGLGGGAQGFDSFETGHEE